MNKEQLFQCVFGQVLDYGDGAFIKKCTKWGLDTLETLEKNGRILVAVNGERGNDFMYAVTTAFIVGEFGKLAFNNPFSGETEIELDGLGLGFDHIEAYIDDTLRSERREELRRDNYVKLEDIWSSVQEWKQNIHQSLVAIYIEKGEEEPIYAIYTSLVAIFEAQNAETKGIVSSTSTSRELSAYSYVDQIFQN